MSVDHRNLLATQHGCQCAGENTKNAQGGTSADGGASTASGCQCPGNPTLASCPMNHAYAMLDPEIGTYKSLDCSVVVYEVQQLLQRLSEHDAVAEEVRNGVAECPHAKELAELEEKLRGKLQAACTECAPESLRSSLLAYIHQACGGEQLADGNSD